MSEQETTTSKRKTTKKPTIDFSSSQWLGEIDEEQRKAKQGKTLGMLRNAQQQEGYNFPTVPSSEKVDGKHVDILAHEAHLYHVMQSAGAAVNKVNEKASLRMHKFHEDGFKRHMSMVESGDSSKGQTAIVVHKPTL